LGEGGEGRSRDHAERERERERLWSKHPSGVSRRWSRVYVRFQNAQWIFCVMNLWIFLHFYESFWGPLTRARRRLNALASRVGLGGATLRGVLQIVQLNPPVLSKIRLLLSLLASQLGSWHAGKRAVEVFLYSVCTSYVDVGMQFCLDFAGFFLWLHALLSRLEAIKRRGRRVFVLAAGELVILPRNPTPVNQKEQGGQENLGSDSERRQLELGVRTEGEAGVERETETRTQPVSSSSARQETGNGGEELSHSSSSSSSSSASSSHSPPSVLLPEGGTGLLKPSLSAGKAALSSSSAWVFKKIPDTHSASASERAESPPGGLLRPQAGTARETETGGEKNEEEDCFRRRARGRHKGEGELFEEHS